MAQTITMINRHFYFKRSLKVDSNKLYCMGLHNYSQSG